MRIAFGRIAALTLVLIATGQAAAAPINDITYYIANYPADQNGATLSGTITTDGTIGVITSANIVSWSWTITPAEGSSYTLTSSDPGTGAAIRGPIAASTTSITEPDTIPGQHENYFALAHIQSGLGADLEYNHKTGNNGYVGESDTTTFWSDGNPVLNGSEPWIIATTSSAVPEPSSLALLGLAAVCMAEYARRGAWKRVS